MSSATFNTSKPRVSGNNLEWTGLNNAELLSLQPGASVVYDFGIKIKDKSEYLKTTATAEDYKIEVLAEAQSGQLEPVQSLSQTIYSTGDLAFSQTVELKEQNAEDTKRIYNVKWEFSNQQTEYSDVVINTGTGLEDAWDEVIIEPAELKDLFDYNPSSGKITMRQDKIEPYSGISTDQFVVSFDLAVELESFDASAETDADSDEDEEQADNSELYRDIELLRETTVTAKDVFTQIEFETKESPVVIK